MRKHQLTFVSFIPKYCVTKQIRPETRSLNSSFDYEYLKMLPEEGKHFSIPIFLSLFRNIQRVCSDDDKLNQLDKEN